MKALVSDVIIIVEGVDRAGKTTVANVLSRELKVPVFRNVEFFSAGEERHDRGPTYETEKMWLMLNLIEALDGDVILDRFHLSELVYGFVDRGYVNNNVWKIDERLGRSDAIVVHVRPYDLESASLLHGSDLSVHLKSFDNFVQKSACNVVTGTMFDLERIVEEVTLRWQMKR